MDAGGTVGTGVILALALVADAMMVIFLSIATGPAAGVTELGVPWSGDVSPETGSLRKAA